MLTALLDGDIFCYRVGFSTEEESEGIAAYRIDEMIRTTLTEVGATDFKIFLSCPSAENFRLRVYPEYKAGRPPKPKHLPFLRQHLVDKWHAFIPEGLEADDMMAIEQTSESIICTIDKDLLQVPGKHYNFVKKVFREIEYIEGMRLFYAQFLIGDTSDNIIGIYGLGPKKAMDIMNSCETEQEMFDRVREIYQDDNRMLMNGICLYMKRTLDDDWTETFNFYSDEDIYE